MKDLYGWQANASPDRLTRPLVRQDGQLVETNWDTAMDRVVARTRALLDEQGPSAIGFYTTGQLFAEEYYTLGLIAHGGLGTNHVDGNTRLCTATAAAALKESFACDGQPGSYTEIDHADVIALYGHNAAETQSVLWMRILDRLAGPNPPQIICVDPRSTPEAVAQICDVPAAQIRETAGILGHAEQLLSTVLQGFYQSHQATAAAVQVNNTNIVRGMLGKPGCGILQMNGQPTAENTRECGADGDLPGFRNWSNDAHVEGLARVWNVDPMAIPQYSPPTHVMQMVRYVEDGSIRMLWVSGTNPAVSLPELRRIRSILEQQRLFLVVQDIFLDYARRLDLRDKDGDPLVRWHDPESAFEAWKECTRGRPCDYTGLSYEKLRGGSGVQWPCNDEHPDGTERIYQDGSFWSDPDYCESYGKDMITGAPLEPGEYRAMNPSGTAVLKAGDYLPPLASSGWPPVPGRRLRRRRRPPPRSRTSASAPPERPRPA